MTERGPVKIPTNPCVGEAINLLQKVSTRISSDVGKVEVARGDASNVRRLRRHFTRRQVLALRLAPSFSAERATTCDNNQRG